MQSLCGARADFLNEIVAKYLCPSRSIRPVARLRLEFVRKVCAELVRGVCALRFVRSTCAQCFVRFVRDFLDRIFSIQYSIDLSPC